MADKTIPALKILRGKVGINTATPSQQLHVNGEAYIFTGSTSVRTLSGIFKADTIENSAGASNLKLQTESGGNKHIEITPNGTGNVGINTNAPANKLEVNFTGDDGVRIQNTASSHASLYIDAGTGGVGNAYVRMTARDGTYTMTHWINLQSNGNLVFRPAATGTAANQIIFNQNGSIGIGGTPTSGNKLYVNGATYIDSSLTVDGDIDLESAGQYITFYGDSGPDHSISSRDSAGTAADDLRINSYGALYVNLDSNNNNSSGANFFVGRHGGTGTISDWLLRLDGETGSLRLNKYGSGTHTGTAAYKLAVDSSGNIIETAVGAGQVDGSGTANYISKWTDGDTLGNASIYDNGSNRISLGTINTSPWQALDVRSTGSQFSDGAGGNQNYNITVVDQNAYTSNYAGGILFGGKYNSSGGVTTLGIVSASKVNGDGNHGGKVHIGGRENGTATVPKVLTVTHANVGIGQVDPKADLHIGSSFSDAANDLATAALAIKQTSTSAENGIYLERTGERKGYYIGISGVDGLTFRRNFSGTKSDIMSLTRDGNVGISTTSPGYILDVRTAIQGAMQVKGAQTHGLLLGEAAYSTSALYTGLKTSYMTGVNDYMIISGTTTDGNTYISAKSGGNAHMRAGGNNSTNEIVVSASTGITYKSDVRHEFSTGNVGIGTNAPERHLHVEDLGQIKLENNSTGNWAGIDLKTSGGTNNYAGYFGMLDSNGNFFIDVGSNGDDVIIRQNGETHLGLQGNVAIGTTTSPTARLNVKASGSTVDQIAVTHSGNTVEIAQLGQSANGNSGGALLLKNNSGTDKVYLDAAGSSYINGGNVGINTTSPAYKLDVYGGDARVGTNLRLGNGSAAGNSTNPAITVSGVTTAGVYFENSGVGFGAGSGSKYLFLSSAGNASLGGNGFFKQLGDRPYGTDDLNDYYRSNDEASFCQFYRYDATYGNFANSSGTIATNAPSTLTQSPSQIYAYGALFTLRSINNFRGQFYFAHSASEFYWRSGWGTNGDQNWTRIVGDRNIQTVIHNVGHITTKAGNNLTVGGSITVQPGSGDGILFLKNSAASQILRLDQNSIRTTTTHNINIFTNGNTNQLCVASDGNVGISDGTPENKLTVNGSSRFKDTMFFADSNRGIISWGTMGGGTGFGMQAASGNALSLGANATWDHIVITTAGNVGIGRATAHGKLDILAAALGTSSGDVSVVSRSSSAVGSNTMYLLEEYVRTSAGTDWTSAGVRLQAKTDSTYQGYIQFNGDSNNYGITFGAGAGGTSSPGTTAERMRIDSTGNVGIASASPAATLDVRQGSSNTNNKLVKFVDDVLSVYKVTGLSNHTVTLTCGSYFQAEVVITANQTNGGTYNNLYIRGIWSNNHTSHHWDEIENIGSLTGSSFSITVGQNDVTNSGKLTITHTYSSGSFSKMIVRVTDFSGAHSYSIT